MAWVRFKDLCIDAEDAAAIGRFWRAAIGGELEVMPDGDAVLRGGPLHNIWVNSVPEGKALKNRVHLDLRGEPSRLLDLGATLLAEHDGWSVLADPEGNECCVFPAPSERSDPSRVEPVGEAAAAVFAVCVDSPAPAPLAAWWQARVGGRLVPGPDGAPRWLQDAAGLDGVTWKFVPVEDARTVKNRVHWDVLTDDVDSLRRAGASLIRAADDEMSWTVLADPDGNEFCAFTAPG